MNLLVAGRITGSVLIICAYFVILHVSTFYGAIMHIIADIICIPFYVQNKQWDVAIMLAFLMSIAISKVAILLSVILYGLKNTDPLQLMSVYYQSLLNKLFKILLIEVRYQICYCQVHQALVRPQ